MPDDVQPHLRPCYTCGVHDDAPRVQATAQDGSTALFHFQRECVPDFVLQLLHPCDVALVESGLKDDELRAAILEAEHTDLGLDPTHANYIGDEAAAQVQAA